MGAWPGGGYGAFRFTEKKEIKIAQCIPRNPVYLKWVGTNGNWNYWLFGVNQIRGINITSGGLFAKFIEDLSLQDSDSKFITKNAVPEMLLAAENLDNDDITGLETLLYSPQVMMLLNPLTWSVIGERWQTVKVVPAKFKIKETRSNVHSIELTIQLIEINIQSQ